MSFSFQVNENYIDFKPQKSGIVPKEYFIFQVIDSRKVKGSVGTFVSIDPANSRKPTDQSFNLKDGARSSVERFLSNSVPKNSDLRPVVFKIKTFNISEELQPNGSITGRIETVISFEWSKAGEIEKLVEFNGGSHYTRSSGNLKSIEPALSNTILNAIKYFDKWINLEVSSNEKLAEKINLRIVDHHSEIQTDTLFYSRKQKMTWADFKSAPDYSSGFAAEIFPFFSFEQTSEIKNGAIDIQLILKTYLVRNFSWVKPQARTAYTLNHEQRHFDIVQIVAEKFKSKIYAENLTVDNYQGILSVQYLESLREMNRMQVKYDTETKHGTDGTNQEIWNRNIDKELSKDLKRYAN